MHLRRETVVRSSHSVDVLGRKSHAGCCLATQHQLSGKGHESSEPLFPAELR